MSTICTHCGAPNAAEATRCTLCGTELVLEEVAPVASPPGTKPALEAEGAPALATQAVAAASPAREAAPCPACGAQNAADARFCSQCGTALTTDAAPPAPPSSPKQQVLMLVGVAAVLVLALFAVTQFSKQLDAPQVLGSSNAPITAPHAEIALPPDVAARVDALKEEMAAQPGEASVGARQELIGLLIGVGRVGQVAQEQEALAELVDTPEAWKRTGSYYFDWMETLQDSLKAPVAERVAQAYDRVLALDPNDLQARTELATALLNTQNPMRGVQEIQDVLGRDSTYVPARFSYAAMLMMINELEKARAQFVFVAENAEPDSPYRAQAERAIQELSAAMDTR
ncbi:MAG: zinc-ribbon domain-containing protein [Bacteroidota bacterium]